MDCKKSIKFIFIFFGRCVLGFCQGIEFFLLVRIMKFELRVYYRGVGSVKNKQDVMRYLEISFGGKFLLFLELKRQVEELLWRYGYCKDGLKQEGVENIFIFRFLFVFQ